MIKACMWLLAGVLAAAGAAQAQAPAQTSWPVAADIPTVAPATVGLAGQGGPDITRYLLVRGVNAFEVSPDGRSVAYLTTTTGERELWIADAAGGAPRQLTFGKGVDGLRWLPDGSGVVYWADQQGDGRMGVTVISTDGRRERALVPKTDAFVQFGDISRDGRRVVYASTARTGRDFDTYVADLSGGEPRRVREGRFGEYPTAWRPGAPEVLISEARGEDGADVHLLNTETGAFRTLLKPADAAAHSDLAWTPDGAGFYLATDRGREFRALAHYDLRSGRLRMVETPAADVEGVRLSRDGRYLAWLTNTGGFHTLNVRDLTTQRTVRTPALPRGMFEIGFADDAPVLGVNVTGPRAPGEVHLVDLRTGTGRRVIGAAWAGLDPESMVEPELLSFKARDGVTLTGLYYRPKSVAAGTAPPLFLRLHGGPSSQARPTYNAPVQYYLARGIGVFDFNYRGSTGFGKSFARLNDKRLRPNEINDLVDAVAWLRSTGRADARRVAVGGGSYGGYLTNAVLGAHPELFVAGVSQVGVSDWVKALEGASPMLKASDRVEYGDIDDPADRAFFASISPINNAAKIKTPLLVQHGANDPQDPVTESDRFVQAVRDAGGQVIYLRFPDEGHGLEKTANQVHTYRRVAEFLEQHLGMGRPRPGGR